MRLVIDIPDWYYSELQEFKHPNFVDVAIRDGVILPKGHGRLIDANELEECKEMMNTISGESKYAVRMVDIRNIPTIIEADEED